MNLTRPLLRSGIGVRRILALAMLLAAVAAVAYLERWIGGTLDLRLLYFLIVLSGAVLLPRLVALTVAGAVAVVSVGISGAQDVSLVVNQGELAVVFFLFGIARSWQLVGAREFSLVTAVASMVHRAADNSPHLTGGAQPGNAGPPPAPKDPGTGHAAD